MPDMYKKVDCGDWDSMLNLFEAITGYSPNRVLEGSLNVIHQDNGGDVVEFTTLEPTRLPVDPESRYKNHRIRLHPGEELKKGTTP